ncbi:MULTISPECIES: hypothetical protein [Croceicoccus]|uniref:hypothetical protein n=1 Tax=Croceicoccus TaxID=1295327 RepID=UPI001923847C|nr:MULTISPECIES: hypothetical protein [Croceicoccus]QQN73014.1 hypothetical protein JD971_08885 [Croceicoccus sp. YJ47]
MTTTPAQIATGKRDMEDVVVGRFRSMGATNPATAVDIVPADPVEADRFDRLRAQGVIRGSGGGFFLDESALAELRTQRKGALYGGLGGVAVIGGLLTWLLRRGR